MPKVAYVASSLGRGLKFHFAHLAVALHEKLPNLVVISGPGEQDRELFRKLKQERIRCYVDPCVDEPSLGNLVKGIGFFRQIMNHEKIDIMHVQSMYCLFLVFLSSKILFGSRKPKILCTVHGFLQGRRFQKVGLFLGSLFMDVCANSIIPVAEATAGKLIKCGLLRSKVKVIHNGIDCRVFDETTVDSKTSFLNSNFKESSEILLSYCANLIPRKGHKYLIMALSEVLREHPTVRLTLTGDGPLKDELIDLTRDLGNSKNVHFTGRVSYEELYRLLAMTDIYVFPSLSESFPFAILEAMAAGKPIVATDVGGVSEAVSDGVNGRLVPPGDPKSLAQAIVELLSDPNRAREMGESSRALAEEKFHLARIAYELARFYEHSFEIDNI